jgi:hypothetical protein
MRYLLLATLLVFGLATVASAQPSDLVGVSGFTVNTNGTLSGAGTLGGVDGTIISTVNSGDCTSSCNGTWIMVVNSMPFAGGNFSCSTSDCMYSGNVMTPGATAFAISTIVSPMGTDANAAIVSHTLWVNDVTGWANLHPAVIAGMNMSTSQFINNASHDNGNGM